MCVITGFHYIIKIISNLFASDASKAGGFQRWRARNFFSPLQRRRKSVQPGQMSNMYWNISILRVWKKRIQHLQTIVHKQKIALCKSIISTSSIIENSNICSFLSLRIHLDLNNSADFGNRYIESTDFDLSEHWNFFQDPEWNLEASNGKGAAGSIVTESPVSAL